MSLVKHCDRHPDRLAIGVCVVTHRAICRECSTQYQGVNYSKEGLERLLASQHHAQRQAGRGNRWVTLALLVTAPLWLYLTWQGFHLTGQLVVDIMQQEQMVHWE